MKPCTRATTVAIIAAVALSACNAKRPPVPSAAALKVLPAVTVTVDPQLDAERAAAFNKSDGPTLLRDAVLAELGKTNKGATLQGTQVQLQVTRFRLRSTATGVWFGGMAGADMLDVSVSLVRDGTTERTFATGTGGIAAGLIKPSAEGRLNGLVTTVAERVVAQL